MTKSAKINALLLTICLSLSPHWVQAAAPAVTILAQASMVPGGVGVIATGMEIAAAEGSLIYAPTLRVILSTGNYILNDNTVILDHGHGLTSLDSHMNTIAVTSGTVVNTGDQIGGVGQNDRFSGAHLPWRISLNNTHVDPALFLHSEELQELFES